MCTNTLRQGVPILSGKVYQLSGKVYQKLEHASGAVSAAYTITIEATAKPVVHGPCRQPVALLPKIKKHLKEMERERRITKVFQTKDWVNS